MAGKGKGKGAVRVETPPTPPVVPVVEAPVVEAPAAGGSDDKKAKEALRARDRRAKEKSDKEVAEAAEKVKAKRRGFYIKPGLSITSRKGIVVGASKGEEVWEGDKVTSEHFIDEVGERLFNSGAIVEVK